MKEIVANDLSKHELSVNVDTEKVKSYSFARKDDCVFNFDLVIWDNHLCISGDMGTYTFKRKNPEGLFIDLSLDYIVEKLVSVDRTEDYRKLTYDSIRSYLEDILIYSSEFETEETDDMLDSLEDSIYNAVYIKSLDDLYEEFVSTFGELSDEFNFDLCYTYTYNFIWCLYAIQWGLNKVKI